MKTRKHLVALIAAALCGTLFAAHASAPAYPNFGLPRVEEMMFLVLQIGIIIFAAKIGGMFASLFKLPSILGELAAGVVIGPWALGGIGFGTGVFQYGLFNGGALRAMNAAVESAATPMFGTMAGAHAMFDATSPALYGIATLASIILLFLSGLETNLKMFLKYSFVGSMVGVGGVVFSFVFGDLCAVYLLPYFFPAKFGALATMHIGEAMMQAAPMYMGIMSTATSVGITARILSERKKMDSEEGVTIMAGAVIDDVLGLIVLAIGNGIIAATLAAADGGKSNGIPWGKIGMVAVKAFGVWVGATFIGVLLARRIAWLLKLFKSEQAIATLAFGLSMILAGFFEYMGLAMIIGAYVVGLALSRTDLKHIIQETLAPVYTFLVPIFFCVMGMMVDVNALMSKPVLIFGAIYTALAIFAKVFGCALPSWFCGFNFLGGMRIGAGMVPRGEVALIIAGLGLSNGFLSQEIFGIGILMTLVTTVIAPPALVGLFIPKKKGVRHPRTSMENSRTVHFTMPEGQIANIIFDKLVDAFHNEGFYTCRLAEDANVSIWEITKDDMELSFTRRDTEIFIECTPHEEEIFSKAWEEVMSEMIHLATTLAKPLTRREIIGALAANNDEDQPVASTTTEVRTPSAVSRTVQNFLMIPSFKATSKKEAIEKLVDAIAIANDKHVKDVEAAKKAVFIREESMPTGIDHGIALPHGRTDAVDSIMGVVALVDNSQNENGIIPDYETIDHSVVQIIVLTLAPKSEQSPYLQFMAYISRVLREGDSHKQLLECKTEKEMHDFFKERK